MYLISTGAYLPGEKPITNEMLSDIFGSSVDLIGDYFGVKSRYFAVDYKTGKFKGEFNSDFCYKASKNALDKIDFDPNEIDLILCATNTPDLILPQVSVLVQEKLKIKNAITIDIRGGCSAPLQCLLIAESFIQRGLAKNVLVIGSECFSTIYYPYLLSHKKDFRAKDVMNSLIFGDGAASFILSKDKIGDNAYIIEDTVSQSSHADWPSGFVVALGGSKVKQFGESELSLGELMKHYPKEIEKYLPKMVEVVLKEIQNKGLEIEKIKYLVGPQANKRLIATLNELFKKQSSNYFYYGDVTGNVPAGALLLAFNKLVETKTIDSNDKVLIMGIESPKWMYGYCTLKKV